MSKETNSFKVSADINKIVRERVRDLIKECVTDAVNLHQDALMSVACSCYLQGFRDAQDYRWTREFPDKQAFYWHWDGDQDSAPLPYSIAYMGTSGEYAAMAGQYGMTCARDTKDFGGWWMFLSEPSTKDVEA